MGHIQLGSSDVIRTWFGHDTQRIHFATAGTRSPHLRWVRRSGLNGSPQDDSTRGIMRHHETHMSGCQRDEPKMNQNLTKAQNELESTAGSSRLPSWNRCHGTFCKKWTGALQYRSWKSYCKKKPFTIRDSLGFFKWPERYHKKKHIYIYIYIYICVCVCMYCIYIYMYICIYVYKEKN